MSANTVGNLNKILATSVVYYQKLHHFHWRVKGRMFFKLHEKFEELYDHWAGFMDDVAERILALNAEPIGSLRLAIEHSAISEEEGNMSAKMMVEIAKVDMETQLHLLRETIEQAEKEGDRSTVNLLDGYADQMEKTLWMLRSFLEGDCC